MTQLLPCCGISPHEAGRAHVMQSAQEGSTAAGVQLACHIMLYFLTIQPDIPVMQRTLLCPSIPSFLVP